MKISNARKILDVKQEDTPSQIKKQYYKLALSCHPDKPGGNTEEFQRLSEAYKCVTNQRDIILPLLFHSSIHTVLSMLDKTVLRSLYTILIEFDTIIPPEIFTTLHKHLPTILILEPTIEDLLNQRVYIHTHENVKYSIPMWHIELEYDTFIVLFKRDLLGIDDDNNIFMTIHASISTIFKHGLFIESINHAVDVSSLRIVQDQLYMVPNTIPLINERNVCMVNGVGNYIIHLILDL